MRLIDADALADALFEKRKNYPQWVAEMIGNMPDVVVRCKDCRFAHLTYDGLCKQCEQIMDDEDNMLTLYLPVDFYCAFGERKDGDWG